MACIAMCMGCNEKDDPAGRPSGTVLVPEDVARLLASVPIGEDQIREVLDAVGASCGNGYDEEYPMKNLLSVPGSGVGDGVVGVKSSPSYSYPLKDMLRDQLEKASSTKGGSFDVVRPGDVSVDEYLSELERSGLQIYWPFSELTSGMDELPVLTFDPEDESLANVGYRIVVDGSGRRSVEEITVDEDYAMHHPVWVVNRNDDCDCTTLELLRKMDPGWADGDGFITVGHHPAAAPTRAKTCKSLVLRDFTMNRNFDNWFAGGSEFWVKVGSVEDFVASTEAELKLYTPQVTDFMIVVKRSELGEAKPYNVMLVSEWTEQLDRCALMIVEDDGGTRTSWNCSCIVKVESKSYGFDMTLPLNIYDDIVWRGQLSYTYLSSHSGQKGHFGDVDLTFEIVD